MPFKNSILFLIKNFSQLLLCQSDFAGKKFVRVRFFYFLILRGI